MYFSNRQPLVPRNGHKVIAALISRISGCQNQNEVSLADQTDHEKEIVSELWDGDVEYRLDKFDHQFARMVEAAKRDGPSTLAHRFEELKAKDEELQREKGNLLAAILKAGPTSS